MRLVLAVYIGLLAALIGFASIAGVILFGETGPSNPIEALAGRHAYSIVSWELHSFPQKWLYKAGRFFKGSDGRDDDAILRRYFEIAEQLRDAESRGEPPPEAVAAERSRLENRVEDILEGRITRLLEEDGLAMRPPIFRDLGVVFPPVDFELDSPPRVLAVSPRARIELAGSYLLTPGISAETARGVEEEAEAARLTAKYEGGASALVISTGGVATYPSVVPELASYDSLVPTVIHEWVHQYLAFFPLGSSYFAGNDVRTINESAANLAARGLANAYFGRYGRLGSPPPAPAATPGDGFDFRKEMRALRLRVEELLAAGNIAQAEALMENKREEFARQGIFIRRLNQAYFAFHGSYADTPASIDPIGPKLETLLQRAGSPGQFLRMIAGVTSERELDAVLARTAG